MAVAGLCGHAQWATCHRVDRIAKVRRIVRVGWKPHARALAYAAAAQNKSVAPTQTTGTALAGFEGVTLRRRASDAVRNSALLSNANRLLRNHLRGPARPQADTEEANQAWKTWASQVGYRHQAGSFAQVVAKALETLLQHGEAFIQRVIVDRDAWNPNGLLLLVRSGEDVDHGPGDQGFLYSQGSHLAGVFFLQFQPARGFSFNAPEFFPGFVDARSLVHLRISHSADALDGEPHAHAAITPDKILTEMQLADMRAGQNAANITAFTHSARASATGRRMNTNAPTFQGPNGQTIEQWPSGTIIHANGVDGVLFPRRDQQAVAYSENKALVAAGVGLTSELVGGSTSEASMSSLMHATAVMRETSESLAMDGGVGVMYTKLLEWFLAAELLVNRDWTREEWVWIPPRPIQVKPVETIRALIMQIDSQLMSRKQAILELGRDIRVVDRDNKADTQPALEASGDVRLVLDAA